MRSSSWTCGSSRAAASGSPDSGYVPDIIGLTTHGFAEVPIVNRIARTCKTLWPDAAVVIGGGQATVSPNLFDQQSVDLIVRGPGERVWRDLCRTGVKRGPVRIVQDPDPPRVYSYPLPDRENHRPSTASTTRPESRITPGGPGATAAGPASRCSRKVVPSGAVSASSGMRISVSIGSGSSLRSLQICRAWRRSTSISATTIHSPMRTTPGELADAIQKAGIKKEAVELLPGRSHLQLP